MNLTQEISAMLVEEGCNVFGFANLGMLPPETRQNYDTGIIIGLSYTKEAMAQSKNRQPALYYKELTAINKRLPKLAELAADFLINRGYKALAKTAVVVQQEKDTPRFTTMLPHKTVATLAGIGWIGKTATLVTKEAGPALRLVSVLTNAPLECGTPITKSQCPPSCMVCADICPGKAANGKQWAVDVQRDEFFDAEACFAAARAYAKETLHIEETICGQCVAHCPLTRAALKF